MAKSKLPYDRLTFDGNFCDIAKCRKERWGKDCRCLCAQESMLKSGYVYYEQLYYHASSFVNSWEEEATPGFYGDGEDFEYLVEDVLLWAELPDNINTLVLEAEP